MRSGEGGGSYGAGPFTGAIFILSRRDIGCGEGGGDVAESFFEGTAVSLFTITSTFKGRSDTIGVNQQQFEDR